MQSTQVSRAARKRDEHLSPDGKWRSFPKVPCLLQYVSNGNYYARARVNGKLIRESPKTATLSIARLRLADFLKKHQKARGTIAELKLPESAQFKALLENLRKRSGGWGPRIVNLIEFLACSGARIRSEALWFNEARIFYLGCGLVLTWTSEPGSSYQVLVKDGFDADSWTPISDKILAAGLRTSWLDPVATAVGGRLYRIELVGL